MGWRAYFGDRYDDLRTSLVNEVIEQNSPSSESKIAPNDVTTLLPDEIDAFINSSTATRLLHTSELSNRLRYHLRNSVLEPMCAGRVREPTGRMLINEQTNSDAESHTTSHLLSIDIFAAGLNAAQFQNMWKAPFEGEASFSEFAKSISNSPFEWLRSSQLRLW